jgi:hypothetical protein
MPYCPECRYEYRAGIIRCSDCDMPLVEKLPSSRDRPLRLIELYRGLTPEVHILEEALRQEGIPSLVRAVGPLVGLVGDLVPPMFSQLLISADDYEQHRYIIDDCLQFVGC